VSEFERIIQIQPPFDKRHTNPNKNYGIHGMTLRFVLKGPKGATQFVYYTGQYLKHVSDELFFTPRARDYNPFKGMGADIGLHSYKPQYEGQTPMDGECDILGCQCYYDGSSLQAAEFEDEFLKNGTDAVWPMLEQRYRSWFEEKP
jgi:hypothetical protein